MSAVCQSWPTLPPTGCSDPATADREKPLAAPRMGCCPITSPVCCPSRCHQFDRRRQAPEVELSNVRTGRAECSESWPVVPAYIALDCRTGMASRGGAITAAPGLGGGGSHSDSRWTDHRPSQSLAGLPQAASRLLTSRAFVARTGCTGSRSARHHRANRRHTDRGRSAELMTRGRPRPHHKEDPSHGRSGQPRPSGTWHQPDTLSQKEKRHHDRHDHW